MIAINAIDPEGRLIDHPTPGLQGRLYCIFEYYPAGERTIFAGEAFGLIFEFPTSQGRVSPIHTGHQPALADHPLFSATLIGGCVNPIRSYSEQQHWAPFVTALTQHFKTNGPLRIWTADPHLYINDATGRWTWRRVGHADDTQDTWDRPIYRFEQYAATPPPLS